MSLSIGDVVARSGVSRDTQVRHFLSAKTPKATRAERVEAALVRLDDLSTALDEQAAHLKKARTLVRRWRSELEGVDPDARC